MKIKVKQVLLGVLLLNSIIVFAQKEDFIRSNREYALGTYYGDVPKYSYIRDMKGELKPFIGVYRANYKGRETTLYITEEKRKYIDLGDLLSDYETLCASADWTVNGNVNAYQAESKQVYYSKLNETYIIYETSNCP